MFNNLAEDIAFLLIKNKTVEVEQRDIYIYGLEVILLNGSLLVVFLVTSIIFNEITNFFAYLLFFLPLRIFTGGFHAKTSERCFLLSTLMYGTSMVLVKYLPYLFQEWSWIITGFVSLIVILIMSPLINKNNPLNRTQITRNRIIVYAILIIDLVIFILCCKFNWTIATNEMIFITLDAILLIMGKITPYLE